jgi:hypothetical protein
LPARLKTGFQTPKKRRRRVSAARFSLLFPCRGRGWCRRLCVIVRIVARLLRACLRRILRLGIGEFGFFFFSFFFLLVAWSLLRGTVGHRCCLVLSCLVWFLMDTWAFTLVSPPSSTLIYITPQYKPSYPNIHKLTSYPYSHLRHLRGRTNLSSYSQDTTIASGHAMTNYFCKTCGSLMYRVGAAFPDCSILRLGTVDDFNLVETKLKPTRELFVKDRVSWFGGVQGDEVKRFQAML